MRSLRIAITADPEIPVPPRHYGGIERIVHLLACGLTERGHEVTLFADKNSGFHAGFVPYPGETIRNAARDSSECRAGQVRYKGDISILSIASAACVT